MAMSVSIATGRRQQADSRHAHDAFMQSTAAQSVRVSIGWPTRKCALGEFTPRRVHAQANLPRLFVFVSSVRDD